ncbi:MAG: hypothetical protein WC682_01875 [Parcubacteria group bacterium]|jgi:hypothetical protein
MKMNKWLRVIVLLVALPLLGCVDKSITENGMKTPEEGISIKSLNQMEKEGVKYIVTFPVVVNAGIHGVEGQTFIIKGKNGKAMFVDAGVFPLMFKRGGVLAKKGDGFYFLTDMNMFGDHFAQAIVIGRKNEVEKVIALSRDGFLMANVFGEGFNYDTTKFYDVPSYQKEIFSGVGMDLADIDRTFRQYFEKRGIVVPAEAVFVREIKVGSPEWQSFKGEVTDRLGNGYETPNGEVRQGYISTEDFAKEASKNEGATTSQRFFKSFNIGFTGEPISSAILTGGSLVNSGIRATNTGMEGMYSQAPCIRADLKERFELSYREYQTLIQTLYADLYRKDQKIRVLEAKIK